MGRRKGLPRNQRVEPTYTFFNKGKLAVTVRDSAVVFNSTIEDAAVAIANAVLELKREFPNSPSVSWGSMIAYFKDKKVTLSLGPPCTIDEKDWQNLKRGVEKICNDLTAFM